MAKMTIFIQINGVQPGKPVTIETDHGAPTFDHLCKAVERTFDVPRSLQRYLIRGQFVARKKYKLLDELGLRDRSSLILLGQMRSRMEVDDYPSDDEETRRDLALFDRQLAEYWQEMHTVDKFDDTIIAIGKAVTEVKEQMLQFKQIPHPKCGQLKEFVEVQTKQLNDLISQANLKMDKANKLNLSPKMERERPLLIQSIQIIIDRCNELKKILAEAKLPRA